MIYIPGSIITLSPDLSVLIAILLRVYWSAINGETLALIPPVPIPIIKIDAMKPPRPAPLLRKEGSDVRRRMRRPAI